MQHYTNSVIAFNGDRVANATITVTDLFGNAVTIYQDFAGTTPLASTTTNNNGEFDFYIPAGRYNITASGVGISGYTISDEFIGIADSSVSPFIQSGAGAVSRYAQDKMREIVSVKDFGAVGDGVADDTAAFTTALAYCAANQSLYSTFRNGPCLFIPRGQYVLTSSLTYSGGSISILGEGEFSSTLRWTSAGGLAITLPSNDCRINIKGIDIQSATTSAGTAITITGYSTTSSNFQHVLIKDVYIWSDYGTSYWNKAIQLTDCWHYIIENVFFKGASSTANWGVFLELQGRSIDGRILNCYAYGCTSAVYVNSTTLEGLRIDNCSFVAVQFGVYKPTTTGLPPHYTIRGTHIAAYSNCVSIQNATSLIISDCLFYLGTQSGFVVPAGGAAIYLKNITSLQVHSNMISGQQNPVTVTKYGVIIDTCDYFWILDNYIDLMEYGISANVTCNNGRIRDNQFWTCTNNILDQTADANVATTAIVNNLLPNYHESVVCSKLSADQLNVTGDGTLYTIKFDELYDQSSAYNPATGNFTAPSTGIYEVNCNVLFKGLTATHTDITLRINTTGGQYDGQSTAASRTSFGWFTAVNVTTIPMTKNDILNIVVIVAGTGKTVDIGSGSSLLIKQAS